MATAPAKPPLHNFPLSFLKWGSKNHTNTNHRYRRPASAERPESDDDSTDVAANRVGSRTARHRFSLASCSSDKLPKQQPPPQLQNSEESDDDATKTAAAEEEEAEVQKPWNLRPRRAAPPPVTTMTKVNGTRGGGDASAVHEAEAEAEAPKSMRLRGLAEGGGPSVEKKEKRKFWIALSKEEIEEDIFIMTGSRPARRPKKRPKNVQKNLDSVFPALWLVGFSADAYRAADAPAKK